ncbi:MAG TPA: hypothetical protein VIK33_15320 [Anaerolineae bacterium]
MKRAILIGLGALALAGCYAPKDYAEGDAVVIAAKTEAQRQEVAIAAEATRQGVIAAGKAELELERERELQRQTLAQQAQAQEADHAARLADIEAQSTQRLADIEAQRAEAMARGSVAWVWPVGGAAVLFVLAAGATVTAVRMGSAWALKVRRQADIPLMINYDPHTLTAPIMLALVAGVPTLVNPNTGDVLPLNAAHNAEAARLRYMAAQNIVALQAQAH